MNHTSHSILSVNETVLIKSGGTELVCRVTEVRAAADDPAGPSVSMSDVTMDEPYRGRISIHTDFYISASDVNAITIEGSKRLPDGQLPEDVVHVTTRDGEWFPVRKAMLAPCIKLTKYVQAGRGKYNGIPTLSDDERSEDAPTDDGCPHCKVPIDCCTFDRVLVFIASLLFPDEQTFVLDPSEVNALTDAAEALGLMPLADLCTSQASSFDSRVRKDKHIRLAEVVKRNDENDELLIILDGMVLDITRWIDEHPGGPSIIPTQALNIDCTVFFEMYHVSRQSFLYLKSFYIGELAPEDLTKLRSSAEGVEASEGFLHSLRSYTTEWRAQISETQGDKVHKSL
jgi:cytochrome b involved in lipid metabolism